MFKTLLASFFLIFCVINVNATNKPTQQKKLEYAEKIIGSIFKVMKSKDTKDQKILKIKKITEQEIDFEWNAKIALGVKARTMQPEELKKFVLLYKEILCENLASKFSIVQNLKKEAIVFEDRVIKLNDTDDLIAFYIELNKNIKIDIKVNITTIDKDKDQFKIMDLIIGGLSVAVSYRNEFNSYIDAHGIEALNGHLEKIIKDNKNK